MGQKLPEYSLHYVTMISTILLKTISTVMFEMQGKAILSLLR